MLSAATSQADAMQTLADANRVMADAAQLSAENSQRIARANELGLETAVHSLEATQRSVQVAQDIARAEQRAWLGVASVTGKPVVGEAMRPIVTIVNSGRTPARNVLSSQFVDGAEPYKRIWYYNNSYPVGSVTRRLAIMPGETFTLEFEVSGGEVMTEDLMRELVIDRQVILFGRVSYDDIFGQTHILQAGFTYSEYRGPGSRYEDYTPGVDDDGRLAKYGPEAVPDFEPCEIRQKKDRRDP
jgi:hypothetical protein